jgi:hypothetical protein
VSQIDGVQFAEAWAEKLEVLVADATTETPVFYIGRGSLIRNKRAAGRPKDLDDLEFLEASEH